MQYYKYSNPYFKFNVVPSNLSHKTTIQSKIKFQHFKENHMLLNGLNRNQRSPSTSYLQTSNHKYNLCDSFTPIQKHSLCKQLEPSKYEYSSKKKLIKNVGCDRTILLKISQPSLLPSNIQKCKTNYQQTNKSNQLQMSKSTKSFYDNPFISINLKKTIKEERLKAETNKKITIESTLNQFQKLRKIGKGKFGEVVLVRHRRTNFICAMKIINKKTLVQQKVQHQLCKQIRIHSKFKHINIIQFYGFFSDSDNFYILLQYAVDGSLYNKLRTINRFQQAQALRITKQICEGVKYIHDYGYLQRDIKPQNIMLQFNIVKICDFGWSAEYQMRKSTVGTPLYYSPQVVRKQAYDGSIDVWAIGILTYQLIVGRIPFSIFTQNNLNQILQKEVIFPTYVDISTQCKELILKTLKKYQILRLTIRQILNQKIIKDIKNQFLDYTIYQQIKNI